MRVIEMGEVPRRSVDAYGSIGFRVSRIAPEAHVVVAHLADGGRIGRHDAVVDQLLVVLTGRCEVSGANGVRREIGSGQAALWDAEEPHETRALADVTLLVVEAAGLADDLT